MIEQRGLPHLAVVDINMPGMDGFMFCETVQQYADLPVIILTAVDQEETVIRGIKYFAEDYVTSAKAGDEVENLFRHLGCLVLD